MLEQATKWEQELTNWKLEQLKSRPRQIWTGSWRITSSNKKYNLDEYEWNKQISLFDGEGGIMITFTYDNNIERTKKALHKFWNKLWNS